MNKFKPGDKVWYTPSHYKESGDKLYGVVCASPLLNSGAWTGAEVWGYWGNTKYPTWVHEREVHLLEPRYSRNLPAWW